MRASYQKIFKPSTVDLSQFSWHFCLFVYGSMAIVWLCVDCGWMPIVYLSARQMKGAWYIFAEEMKEWISLTHTYTHPSPHPPLFPCLRASSKGQCSLWDTDFGSDVSSNWTPILNPLFQGHRSTVAALSVNNWIHIHLMVNRWSCITTFPTLLYIMTVT